MISSCRSPNSISLFTSFFLVRGLKGTFTFSMNPAKQENENSSFINDNNRLPDKDEISSSSFFSKVGQETLSRLFSGNFHQQTKDADDDKDAVAVNAAVGRQLEYLHCLLMNLHCPVIKNVFLLVEDAKSAELLQEVLSFNKKSSSNLFAEKRHKLVPILFNPQDTSRRIVEAAEINPNNNLNKLATLNNQPLYSDFFHLARQMLHPTRDVAAVCNSDIHFHTRQMIDDADVKKWFFQGEKRSGNNIETVLALTRYEEDISSFHFEETAMKKNNNLDKNDETSSILEPRNVTTAPLIDDYRGSHDAFLFRPKIISDEFINRVRHPQNAYQSENIVIDSFMKLNNDVKAEEEKQKVVVDLRNPCINGGFRIAHKHESDVRQWYPPLNDGRYGKVQPE